MDKKIIQYPELQGIVSNICRKILISNWRPDYVVGLTRGGLLPAVMISHYLEIPCHTLKVSLRDFTDNESNAWMSEDAFGYQDQQKNILLVDDINDSGSTFNWIIQDWQTSCLPVNERWKNVWNNNVRFAVIVDNLASACNVKMDYVGFEINKQERDVWIEFPWENWWHK